MQVYPSVLETTKNRIISKTKRVRGLVLEIQIDICDGNFVPSKTFASRGDIKSLAAIRKITKGFALELDLMVDLTKTPTLKRWIQNLRAIKPERIIFHGGSTNNWEIVFRDLTVQKKLISEIGLGIHLDHSVKEIRHLLETYPFSFVQIMGIEEVGYSGQSFSKKALNRMKWVRKNYPDLPISVDGGVKLENAGAMKNAGATRICPNSGLFKTTNIIETIDSFKKI